MLTVTAGLTAADTTAYAQTWVAEDRTFRCRVSRDDLRAMLFTTDPELDLPQEQALTAVEYATVAALLDAGMDVIIDTAHLTDTHRIVWAGLAAVKGHDFVVRDEGRRSATDE